MADGMGERLARVNGCIARALARAGRPEGSVRLVAVSKRHPAEAIRAAYAEGCRDFGENYGQELLEKAEALADLPALRWHHIGHLQTNKVRALIGPVALFHAVDRPKLLDELERRAAQHDRVVEALIQLNLAGEASKSGCGPDELARLLEHAAGQKHVRVIGLMTMPPPVDDPEQVRPFFRQLFELRERHGGAAALPELSMGMSHDFEVAIEEGATIVRVGTAIFGPR